MSSCSSNFQMPDCQRLGMLMLLRDGCSMSLQFNVQLHPLSATGSADQGFKSQISTDPVPEMSTN